MGKPKKSHRGDSSASSTSTSEAHAEKFTEVSGTTCSKALNRHDGTIEVVIVGFVLPAVVTAFALFVGSHNAFKSESEGGIRPHFLTRIFLCVIVDATYGGAATALVLPPARALACTLPGALVPCERSDRERQERTQNDPSVLWPVPGSELPLEWVKAAEDRRGPKVRTGRQPFFLNHVRGSTRLRQAASRVALAAGTILMSVVMAKFVDRTDMSYIGLDLKIRDLAWGFVVGAGSVVVLFVVEVALGWICVVGYNEVVVPGESLFINLLWDIIFHIGVSINEEVSLRGWVLIHAAAYISTLGAPATTAMILSSVVQAGIFALFHFGSPGATRVGLINLLFGGSAGALNVVLSGGLSFPIGWHFGWNIFMGHLLGMSTSGIPMSAKIVSIVPHPAKAQLHGGRFGPEQSPLAPAAYLIGCVCLVALYGMDGIELWRDRLGSASLSGL